MYIVLYCIAMEAPHDKVCIIHCSEFSNRMILMSESNVAPSHYLRSL